MGLSSTGSIAVNNLQISLKKGLYPEELLLENRFSVSAEVFYSPDDLNAGDFLNYEELAEILYQEMCKDIHLLEAIAENILKRIMHAFSRANRATVKIEKLDPGFKSRQIGAVVVSMELSR